MKTPSEKSQKIRRLFFGNLSWDATAADVRALLDDLGIPSTEIDVLAHPDTGRSRGCCFVTFDDDGSAERCLSMVDGADLMGRALRVEKARDKDGGKARGRDRGRRGLGEDRRRTWE